MSLSKPRHKRVRTNLPLTWRASFASTIHNISVGGLYFKCTTPPQVGEPIELNFMLPGTQVAIHANGLVRWVSNHAWSMDNDVLAGVGVEFVELGEAQQQLLQHYVENKPAELRLGNRVAVRLVVDYFFAGENFRSIANELSPNGMFLVSDEPHQLEDVLHLRFLLPDVQAMIKARAVVRWRHEAIPAALENIITPGMGLEFTDVSEEDRQVIRHFIDNFNRSAN